MSVSAFGAQADVRAAELRSTGDGMRFDAILTDRKTGHARTIADLFLPMFGRHNVQNALAALEVCDRVFIMDRGRIVETCPVAALAAADGPRRALADADWREINEQLPGWLPMHPYNDLLGDGIPECERTWAFDFRVMPPTAWWRVPSGIGSTWSR